MAVDFEDSISKMERLAGVGHGTVVKWQKEILKLVRRLADEGQIVLGGAGGEEMI